jgi:ferritin
LDLPVATQQSDGESKPPLKSTTLIQKKIQMHEKLIEALNFQANHEFFAAQSYEAMAQWCDDQDFKGFFDFFTKQADEERGHARRFLKHLNDCSVCPTFTAIEAPRQNFSTLADLAQHALELEKANSAYIHNCYKAAVESGALASLPFLLEFIEEQVEEESWANTMVTLTIRHECPGSVFDLDRHITKYLEE